MTWLMEVRPVDTDPGDHNWETLAVRLDGDDHWHLFLSFDHCGLWLSPLEVEEFPTEQFRVSAGEGRMAKLVLIFGRAWPSILEDPIEVIGYQVRAMDTVCDSFMERIDRTPLEQVAQWGHSEQITEGELLRASMTADDPFALRG